MLKPSELFERLHNEGKERRRFLKENETHRSSYLYDGEVEKTTGIDLALAPPMHTVNVIACGCAIYHMGKASESVGMHIDLNNIKKSFEISGATLGEIEMRYEMGHNFLQLAEWLKSIGH